MTLVQDPIQAGPHHGEHDGRAARRELRNLAPPFTLSSQAYIAALKSRSKQMSTFMVAGE